MGASHPSHRCKFTKKKKLIKMNQNISHLYIPIPPREETSCLSLSIPIGEYSASIIARAVEDVDAHLLELHTDIAPDGNILVDIRVSHTDPTAVERSLSRYGYELATPATPIPSYLERLLEV